MTFATTYLAADSEQEEGDMTEEELIILTAKEAAEYLRVSLYTLRRMEKDGSLIPFRTPGGHRRYSLSMLNEYLEESRVSSHRRSSGVESGAP
jgi:excisionase family DNA binding protein